MPHISLPENQPGIVSLFEAYPQSASPLKLLAQTLLRGPSSLSILERELIATVVSATNQCRFCTESHAAITRELCKITGGNPDLVDEVLESCETAVISNRRKALLNIAQNVVHNIRMSEEYIASIKAQGIDDRSIHDTVLIAAAFCMYNRYVEGLNTYAPEDREDYKEMGRMIAAHGYL